MTTEGTRADRGPRRSIRYPQNGTENANAYCEMATAPNSSVRLHLNSADKGPTNTPNVYIVKDPTLNIKPMADATTASQSRSDIAVVSIFSSAEPTSSIVPPLFKFVLSDSRATVRFGNNFVDIVGVPLAGHTHGGQIRIPGIGDITNASKAPLRWSNGLISEGERHLYVTSGIGTSGVPLRWGVPPGYAILDVTGEWFNPLAAHIRMWAHGSSQRRKL
jgi:hypothetical protein